jgi:aminoglycoside phosphotransferase (APT) family kinase protein
MMAVETTTALISEERLFAFLRSNLPDLPEGAPISVKRLRAGHSNVTFEIWIGARRLILRRPPAGPLAPSAHDVLREFRILQRLAGHVLRAPTPVIACDDASVIGAPFFLMEHVDGVVLRDVVPPELPTAEARRALSEDIVDTLCEIHAVDWRAMKLDEVVSASADYLGRQISRWSQMLGHSRTREIAGLDEVGAWIAASVPATQGSTLIHGDFKLDNLIVSLADPPTCLAALDWELSTIGDPLADLGWLMVWWAEPGEVFEEPLTLCTATTAPGFLLREELCARYEQLTGRDTSRIAWYEIFALWRLAILFEGSYKRHLDGTADDDWYARLERGVPYLVGRARSLISTQERGVA